MGEHKTYRRLSKEKYLVCIHIHNIMHYNTHTLRTEYCIMIYYCTPAIILVTYTPRKILFLAKAWPTYIISRVYPPP